MNDAEIASAAERIAVQKRGDEGRPKFDGVAIDGLRTQIATEFGRRRGWTFCDQYDRIRPVDLSERWTSLEDNCLCSNAYTFRLPDGTPAAIAGHVYKGDRESVRQDLQRKADGAGMVLSFPTDVPSWWFPGGTTLVLFEPAAGLQREAGR